MLTGPNLPALRAMAATAWPSSPAAASPRWKTCARVAAIPGVEGAIVGMALYTGAIDLPAALRELALTAGHC